MSLKMPKIDFGILDSSYYIEQIQDSLCNLSIQCYTNRQDFLCSDCIYCNENIEDFKKYLKRKIN